MNKKKKRDFGENGFEGWGGYMAAKKAKLHNQFNEGATKEGIFKGISIHVNGYTDPTSEELKRIMMDNGGTYHHYYSVEKTTHIIATNLPDVKVKQIKNLHVKVVKPEWITASLKAGQLLDYSNFLLYTHQSTSQPCLNFKAVPSTSKIEEPSTSTAVTEDVSPQKNSEPKNQNMAPEDKPKPTTSAPQDKPMPSTSRPAKTAVEPNFLSEFYNNSRLHHISTMGATFKQYVGKLRQENRKEFPGRERLKKWLSNTPQGPSTSKYNDDLNFSIEEPLEPQSKTAFNKVIMHIDMDCFFVSVGIRDKPELKGVPVAVTHSKSNTGRAREGADIAYERNFYKQKREAKLKSKTGQEGEISIESRIDDLTENESLSEIASCSYEARRAGVKNGMFMGTAIKLCPNLRAIPYDFEGYKEVAGILYDTVASYTLDIEAVSCDEMFVDCTNLLKETGATPLQFASCLRAQVKEQTRCPASAGFGSNRLLARMATKKAKPDGHFYLEEHAVEEYMKSIKVGDLPGVGFSMVHRLRAMGIATCADLQRLSLDQLRLEGFGTKTAETLYNNCRGKDDRGLTFGQERKSVSAEINYGIRFETSAEAEDFLRRLSAEVHTRLAGDGARSITLKLMVRAKHAPTETAKYMGHGVCDNLTRSSSLAKPARTLDVIQREVLNLFKGVSCKPSDLRGIGIQLSRLEKTSSSEVGALDAFLVKRIENPPVTPKKSEEALKKSEEGPKKNEEAPHIVTAPANPRTPAKSPKKLAAKSPRAPKFKSPSAKASPGKVSPSKRKKMQVPTESKTIKDFMRPRKKSPERVDRAKFELDPDVLAELPEDIRHEILEEYSKSAAEVSVAFALPTVPTDPTDPVTDDGPVSLLDVTFSQVDPDYLNGLPTDLRTEVESSLRRESERKKRQKKEQKLEFLAALPPDIRQEVQIDQQDENAQDEEPDEPKRETLRDMISVSNLKSLIRSWIESADFPQSCDVTMVSEFLQGLIASREIDCIASIMRAIHRNISKRQTAGWRKAYSEIVANVQTTMLAVYEARLDIEDTCST